MAVIFITRIDGGQSRNEGMCLKCARELHIKPVDDIIAKMGLSDEERRKMQEDFLMDVRDCFLSDPDYVVNMEMVDQDEARFPGGSKRFNKIFGGKLQEVMDSLNEALYEEGA